MTARGWVRVAVLVILANAVGGAAVGLGSRYPTTAGVLVMAAVLLGWVAGAVSMLEHLRSDPRREQYDDHEEPPAPTPTFGPDMRDWMRQPPPPPRRDQP